MSGRISTLPLLIKTRKKTNRLLSRFKMFKKKIDECKIKLKRLISSARL